ncbi:MAG: type II secretion system F family protein [Sulfuricurvum sp.]
MKSSDIYAMLKTIHFTLVNGKSLSSGVELLYKTTKNKKDKKLYKKIYGDIKDGLSFSQSLSKHRVGTKDSVAFVSMAEKSLSFRNALGRLLKFMESKREFERESNEKTTVPFIYLFIVSIVVIAMRFFVVPYQIAESKSLSDQVYGLVADHLAFSMVMNNALFILLAVTVSYFLILMLALFSKNYHAKELFSAVAMKLPFASNIIMQFEKFVILNMLGEMMKSGISFKASLRAAISSTTISKFKRAFESDLESIRTKGELSYDPLLFDDIDRSLFVGVGTLDQVGSIMIEVSNKARDKALELSGKFFRLIIAISIFLMAFAVFIEFYTVVLTQLIIQKGLVDLAKGL